MKTTVSKAKVQGVGTIETPETNPLLLHFLSPLELLQNNKSLLNLVQH